MDGDVQALRDELLVLRCQQGDRRAITSLIAAWEGRLFYYVRRLTPQEADAWDVLQKTWVQVVKDIGRLWVLSFRPADREKEFIPKQVRVGGLTPGEPRAI